MSDPTKKCPLCAEEIKAEALICRYCGARFEVSVKGYCTICHVVRDADEIGNCLICGEALIDPHPESRQYSEAGPTRTQGTDVSSAEEFEEISGKSRSRNSVWTCLLLIALLTVLCSFAYVFSYHDMIPIPGVDKFFQNVEYDMQSRSGGVLGEGLYFWDVTNQNDFAWPKTWVLYGENHGYLLDRMEPGETKVFSNAILENNNTHKLEAVPLLKGGNVEIQLCVDFSEEDSWPIQVRKLLGQKRNVDCYSHFNDWKR